MREAAVLAAFLAAGIAATWPRASYLTGKLPPGPDQAEYVWNMWWVAHQVVHLGNPWFTGYMAAPGGIPLGLATLTLVKYSGELPSMFAPSPRLASYGLSGLGSFFYAHTPDEALTTFGVVLTVLAAIGLAVSWRRRSARLLGVLWLGSAVLALGPTLYFAGHQYVPLTQQWDRFPVSPLMPGTWLIRLPGLAFFREPDRLALLGLGAAVKTEG